MPLARLFVNIFQIVRAVMQTGVVAIYMKAIDWVPVKKMRVIVTLTVTVKVDWFVGLIIVHLVFLVGDMIVVRSHQVWFYTY